MIFLKVHGYRVAELGAELGDWYLVMIFERWNPMHKGEKVLVNFSLKLVELPQSDGPGGKPLSR